MSSTEAILKGVKAGVILMDAILSTKAFKEGQILIGTLFVLLGIMMIFSFIEAKNDKMEVEFKKLSASDKEMLDKILKDIEGGRFYSEGAINAIIETIEQANIVVDNPEYKEGFDKCKEVCIDIIKGICPVDEDSKKK